MGEPPPLVGAAVKVTLLPEQIVLSASLDVIATLAVVCKVTVVVELVADVALHPFEAL